MPRVEFEPTIPVFERAKMVHVLERAAAVKGLEVKQMEVNMFNKTK
jgi:hypothetical protein